MGLASGRFEANAWYLEQFYRNLWGVIVFYTTFATSTRLGNVENKTIIYIYAADIPAVVSYDIRYLSVYCVDAISLAIHRRYGGKRPWHPCISGDVYVCGFVPCPNGTSLGYSISLINDFWKFRGTSGITGHEVCRGIIDTYHASFDRNAPIRERGSLFLPKQR